jgi:hypothetical protein
MAVWLAGGLVMLVARWAMPRWPRPVRVRAASTISWSAPPAGLAVLLLGTPLLYITRTGPARAAMPAG